MSIFDKAHRVKAISLDDQVGLLYTSSEPTIGVGVEAPIGTILIWKYNPPKIYQKIGEGNNDWLPIKYDILPSGYENYSSRIIKYVDDTTISVSCSNIKINEYKIQSISTKLSIIYDLLPGEQEEINTWYGVWLFYNPKTSDYVLKLSNNLNNPTIPNGYTLAKLISAVRNNSSGNFLKFIHENNIYKITENSNVIYNANPSKTPPGTILDMSPYICEAIFDQVINLIVKISRGEVDIYTLHNDNSYLLDTIVANANIFENTQTSQLILFGAKPSIAMLRIGSTLATFSISLLSWRVKDI